MSHTLEVSSYNMPTEVVSLIQTQHTFQLNSRIVIATNQMEEMIDNLR